VKPLWISLFWIWTGAALALAQTPADSVQPPGLTIGGPAPGARDPDAAATLVVFNNLDATSADLASYYAKQRNIPFSRLIGLDCPTTEEITRDDYDRTIAQPLRKTFLDRDWWTLRTTDEGHTLVERNKIRFIALMRGIPLKIAPTSAPYPGDVVAGQQPIASRNEAAVDSELACLGYFTRQISGILKNPYYRSYKPIRDANMPPLMLVCRLDAPTPDMVRRMIDDSIAVEQQGLWGFAYVDERSITDGGYEEGEKWLVHIAADARSHGIPVIEDKDPDTFPANYPMRNAAFYYGWYAGGVCGPFLRPDFRFNKGAVAVHIHSGSAGTLRDTNACWAAPLIARGAAATLGNVYEPYLALTSNLDILHERLRNGFTFAESAYMSMRAVSWMATFVGDPLYRPFKAFAEVIGPGPRLSAETQAYREGARAWFAESRAAGETRLKTSGAQMRSGLIFEGLGLLQAAADDPNAALASFQQARRSYANSEDALRVALHEIGLLRKAGRNKDALAFTRKEINAYPNSPTAPLLRAIELQLAPPPPKPPAQQSPSR
jgi:uncharacterized protein (TIGR03790 family)